VDGEAQAPANGDAVEGGSAPPDEGDPVDGESVTSGEPSAGDRPEAPADEGAGEGIVRLDVWATAVFTVVSLAAVALPDPLEFVSVPLDLVLFAAGCGAFLWAYAVAIGRSRYEALTMGGVFFLADRVAPVRVARTLRLALAAQVVVAVAVAAARPFTALAFGVLVPMAGLGLMALWGARHGRFPAKDDGQRAPRSDA
jgi:hypothetical protein